MSNGIKYVQVSEQFGGGLIAGPVDDDGNLLFFDTEIEALQDLAADDDDIKDQILHGERRYDDLPSDDWSVEPVEILRDSCVRLVRHNILWTKADILNMRGMQLSISGAEG